VILPDYKRFPNSPAHKGPFLFAEDIAIPSPLDNPLTIYAPQSGIVRFCVLSNTVWGPLPRFATFLNFINIDVDNHEFYEIAHVTALPGVSLTVGSRVKKDEPILMTALNGYMTQTRGVPDSHVHIMIGKWLNKERTKFTSLKIRWDT
jgi:hypothetical protein